MRRLPLCILLLALATPCALDAQTTRPVAYPQMGTDGSSGNLVPLGYSNASPNFDEGRFQQLIPARFLPSAGGAIFGVDVLSQDGNTTTYPSLTITMSLVPPGSTLSTTFGTNLPAPVVVFQHTNHSITWTRHVWQTIPFDTPFVYDGASDVVIDFQKTYDRIATPPPPRPGHHQTTSDPGRSDLPHPRYAFGTLGSGASTATTAMTSSTQGLKLVFQFAGPPTVTLTASRGGSNNNVFAISGQFDATLYATPAGVYGSLISLGWLPTPFPVRGIAGSVWIDLPSAVPYGSGMVNASGVENFTWTIPNDPGLVGGTLTFQSVASDPNGRLILTNAVDCIING